MATATTSKPALRETVLLTDRPSSRWVIEPNDVERNARGTITGKLSGTVLHFDGATARISERKHPRTGEVETFCNNVPQGWGYDQFIRAIEAHPQFDVRFWIEDKGPHDPQPTVKEMAAAIAEADPEQLRALREEERSTHNRPAVLELIADRALEQGNGAGADGGNSGGGTDNVR